MSDKHYFKPVDSEINLENPEGFKLAVKSLKKGRYYLKIKKYSPRRSLTANGYYWSVVIPYFCAEWGLKPDIKSEAEYMHYDILGQELRQVPDERRPGMTKTKGTHDMTGSEFWKYIYQCDRLYFRHYNGHFPPPKSLGYKPDGDI